MIHQFVNNAWVPGVDKCEGNKVFPQHPAPGIFFNDVTGKWAATEKEVEEELADHLMKMGTLDDILPLQISSDWSAIAKRFENIMRKINNDEAVFLTMVLDPEIGYKLVDTQGYSALRIFDIKKQNPDLAQQTANFVMKFMGATGQLDYIRKQPWYANKSYSVEIVIAYTIGRPTEKLSWHKDTEGKNLFVSLIFNNASNVTSTEWTPDLYPVGTNKTEVLKRAWPDNLIQEVSHAKLQIADQYQKQNKEPVIDVQALGKNGFESWVDELVWHSSPYFAKRGLLSLQEAQKAIQIFIDDDELSEAAYEVFVCLALEPQTEFAQFVQKNGQHTGNLDLLAALKMTGEFMNSFNDDNHAVQILKADIEKVKWETLKTNTVTGQSGPGEDSRILKPSGVEGRSRTMSNLDIQKEQVELPGNLTSRNFIRFWVQVQKNYG